MRRIILAIGAGALAALASAGMADAHAPDRNDSRGPTRGASVHTAAADMTADLIGSVPLGGTASGGTPGDLADVRRR